MYLAIKKKKKNLDTLFSYFQNSKRKREDLQ